METVYLKSERKVQYTDSGFAVSFPLYEFEIDALIKAIELAEELRFFRCCRLLEDLQELQDRFMEKEFQGITFGPVFEPFRALPQAERTFERFQQMKRETGL
jgi:hypothetical protein